jgi:hypothetical protein
LVLRPLPRRCTGADVAAVFTSSMVYSAIQSGHGRRKEQQTRWPPTRQPSKNRRGFPAYRDSLPSGTAGLCRPEVFRARERRAWLRQYPRSARVMPSPSSGHETFFQGPCHRRAFLLGATTSTLKRPSAPYPKRRRFNMPASSYPTLPTAGRLPRRNRDPSFSLLTVSAASW